MSENLINDDTSHSRKPSQTMSALTLAALGIVFGDIGLAQSMRYAKV